MEKDFKKYLSPTDFLEVEHQSTKDFIQDFIYLSTQKEQATALYYKVRDTFLYDPYHLDLRPQALKSSVIIQKSRAWCVEKSIVLATCLRALGIPAKLGYGIVINHIGVERLKKYLRREEIVFHGYVSAYIEGKWIKTTPAFDKNVCRISKVTPLDWDGVKDALLQAYQENKRFMEYVHFYGEFSDVPISLMNNEMKHYYPHLFEEVYNTKDFSFFHI